MATKSTDEIEPEGEPNEDVHIWKRIVTELSLQALDPQIKSCLQSYNPEKPTKSIIATLNKSFKKYTTHDTLNFLSKQEVESANKNELVRKLCLKVKSFFPDVCKICNMSYVIKL
eukprot:TCONS_00063963-protein